MTILDAYQAIDEINMQYVAGSIQADTAMLYISNILQEVGA